MTTCQYPNRGVFVGGWGSGARSYFWIRIKMPIRFLHFRYLVAFLLSVLAAWANLPTSWSRRKYGIFLNSLTESSTSCPIRDSQPNVSHHRMPNQLKMTAVVTVSSQANHAGNSESRKRISTYFESWFLKTPRVQVFIGRKRECSTLDTFRPLSCGPRKTWSLSLYPDALQSSSHESLSNAQVWSSNRYCSTKTSYSP